MADSQDEKRPTRKLTVKNFSVIKEAELEFGKITVLIGPQASGKSLLCKIAHFVVQRVPEIVDDLYKARSPYAMLATRIWEEFCERFSDEGWNGQGFTISYSDASFYSFGLELPSDTSIPRVQFRDGFVESYSAGVAAGASRGFLPTSLRKRQRIEGEDTGFLPILDDSVYIPTGRSFFSIPNRGYAALAVKNLDWITQRYATEYDADYRALLESYNTNLHVLSRFSAQASQILRGRVVSESGRLAFESTGDTKQRPFELLSSGTLELLPLINSLARLAKRARYPDIPTMPASPTGLLYVEEPESSVFPSTQNDLVRLFAWFSNEPSLWMDYVITTHSPYVLASFNNLIEAGQAARNNPKLRNDVAKIIPEQYWIEEGEFRAYCIDDGRLKSILNESGFVEANYLDHVSEVIGNEFDELLRLEYEHTKAS